MLARSLSTAVGPVCVGVLLLASLAGGAPVYGQGDGACVAEECESVGQAEPAVPPAASPTAVRPLVPMARPTQPPVLPFRAPEPPAVSPQPGFGGINAPE
jgi:hypothetical protein